MLKLHPREMKNLSRILTTILCCAPLAYAGAAGQVATTSGHDLTSYNPSNANNNQWATLTNSRYDGSSTAKVDFGNCNALILRCAQPKCGNGGCAEYDIAEKIVEGCVKSNKTCKKYGEDLIESMSAQLVASAAAKANEQQAALDAARIQAEANAAAATAAANAQSQQMQQMQQQMQEMQQQMAQQQEESARQLQSALNQQAQQQQQALDDMKAAATEAAEKNVAGDKNVTSYQQEAIDRGVATDLISRQTLTGQVYTEVENAKTNLVAAQKALNTLFEYGHCDSHGNNCSGPTRVKKWRELARAFIDPYDKTVGDIYDALITAQGTGVDISQVYLMLDNSCNQWAQFACPPGDRIEYTYDGTKATSPRSCGELTSAQEACMEKCINNPDNPPKASTQTLYDYCNSTCNTASACRPCTVQKVLTDADDVYTGWVNQEDPKGNGNTTVIACYSGVLQNNTLFAHMMKRRGGTGMVDLEVLDRWISQVEPDRCYKDSSENSCKVEPKDYCSKDATMKNTLHSTSLSKALTNEDICVKGPQNDSWSDDKDDTCPYIKSTYAICDAHKRNAGDTSDANEIKEILGLKTTVLSQQLYKQYQYLDATIRRLEIQLKKAMVSVNLDVAAGTDSSSSSSKTSNTQFKDCAGKGMDERIFCFRQNYELLSSEINNKKCKSVKKQLVADLKIMNNSTKNIKEDCMNETKLSTTESCKDCLEVYYQGIDTLDNIKLDREAKRQGKYRD